MRQARITAQALHPYRNAARWGAALVALLLPVGACGSVDISNEASASAAGSGGASSESSASATGGVGPSSSSSSGTGVVEPCATAPWARDLAPGSVVHTVRLALGAGCTTIITGGFKGALDLGNGPLTANADAKGFFVAKLDSAGHTIWSRAFELAAGIVALPVTVDAQGDILLGGAFSGTLDLGSGPLTSVGNHDVFVAKLDSDGHPLWIHHYEADGALVIDIAADTSGNVIVGGTFTGKVDFGLGVLQSGFSEHGFLVKLDAAGKPLWHRDIDSPDLATLNGLAVDGTGAVTFIGTFRTSIGLGFSCTGDKDTYLARCDADGTLLWARQLGGDGFQMGMDVAVDAAGNSAIVGSFGGKIDLGNGPIMSQGGSIAFAARYDPQGNITWGRAFKPSPKVALVNEQRINGVAFGAAGQLWMTGRFRWGIDFGGGPLISPTALYMAFVAELDAKGNQIGAVQYGSTNGSPGVGSSGDAITIDDAGRAHVVGTFTGAASFDAGPLTSAGDADAFVATVAF